MSAFLQNLKTITQGLYTLWNGPTGSAIKGHLSIPELIGLFASIAATLVTVQAFVASLPPNTVSPAVTTYLSTTAALVAGILDLLRRLNTGAAIAVQETPDFVAVVSKTDKPIVTE